MRNLDIYTAGVRSVIKNLGEVQTMKDLTKRFGYHYSWIVEIIKFLESQKIIRTERIGMVKIIRITEKGRLLKELFNLIDLIMEER